MMTQLANLSSDPVLREIEDRIDAIGHRYRVQQFVRGALLLVGAVALLTLLAVSAANVMGAGVWAKLTFFAWAAGSAAAAIIWLVKPLLTRPDPVKVARFIEARVGGLHNGLTNALLLGRRSDIESNPWLPAIYAEVLATVQTGNAASAVRMIDLRPLALRILALLLLLSIILGCFRNALGHGWDQLLSPMAFVPKVGAVRIVSVKPGDVQIVVGKPLDLAIVAVGPKALGQPPMRIIFDATSDDAAAGNDAKLPLPKEGISLPASTTDVEGDAESATYSYSYHLDGLERAIRYRVEIAGTQSEWFNAGLIRSVKLTGLSLQVIPPAYTREPPRQLRLSPDQIGKTTLLVPEGSEVELSASLDVPVSGAVLQVGDAASPGGARPAVPMSSLLGGKQFSAQFVVLDDTPVVILLTDAAGQAMFRLPEERLVIGCTKDAAPRIEMHWPAQDQSAAIGAPLRVRATLHDDRGLSSARVMMSIEPPASAASASRPATADAVEMKAVKEQSFEPFAQSGEIEVELQIPTAARGDQTVIRVRVEATDNRDLGKAAGEAPGAQIAALTGPQTTFSPTFQIRLTDAAKSAPPNNHDGEALRQLLRALLDKQKSLHAVAVSARLDDKPALAALAAGQTELRAEMQRIADTFAFATDERAIQKTLLMLVVDPAKDAIDLATLLPTEPSPTGRAKLSSDLQTRQRRIIETLQSLLAIADRAAQATTRPASKPGGDLATRADEMKKLDEAMKEFIKQQQRLLDQTAPLAKKPVDSFDDADKKLLEDLKLAQEKLDAFMQEKIQDFSKLGEQDMANASLLKEMFEVNAEVTMAKDALKAKATEIAVAAEDNALALSKEIETNLEKWLSNLPDRTKWTQEDPLNKTEAPAAELPKELQDLVGKLLEQEEDLLDEAEDQNANWHDSVDKGIGWDAMDGPISNMTAKGITGNQLPNNNEMGGRSGEGRSGKSSGEMVDDTSVGKGGRRTPTRLDPTPFQQGQVKNQSNDPTGGATGGGKLSGAGGQGLEGPVGPKQKQQMQRLAQKQAELRNTAERLNLQYQLGRYDNFELLKAAALMRRVESDFNANQYQTALHRREALLDSLDTSRLLLGGEVHVKEDTTPTGQDKERKESGDAMKGELPPEWKESLKRYYEKLAGE